jgi:hypothetical protein
MRILDSARRHGIGDDDIMHALANAIRFVDFEYKGEERLLVIGPDMNGAMLEIVAMPVSGPDRVIHADRLRPSRYDYLR